MPDEQRCSDAEYVATQAQLALLAQCVAGMPLEGFLGRIEECEVLAPLIAPSLYQEALYNGGADNLEAVKALARAARAFQKVALEVMARAEARR